MLYQEIQPPHILSSFIKFFWTLESDAILSLVSKEKILPDGCQELIFHYGDNFKEYRNGSAEVQPKSFLYGQLTKYIEIAPTGRIGIMGVRFYPHGIHPFLDVPASELTNNIVNVTDLFGEEGKFLEEKIMIAGNNQQRINCLEIFFLAKLKKYNSKDVVIGECLKRVNETKGMVSIESLSHEFNISSRHLERKFTSIVGINPKLLSRIIRFQNVLKLVQSNRINSLTGLAYEAGYYDQAHFIRDFKEFAGVNPKSFFNKQPSFSGFINNS